MAINNKTQLTSLEGRRKLLNNVSGVSIWPSSFGSTWESFFKPFTTNPSGNGIAHFNLPVSVVVSTGLVGANSSGLMPYGYHTQNEGLMYGNTPPTDVDIGLDTWNIRTHGLKTPQVLVGWGYDIFGFPAPNAVSGWTRNGSGVAPSSYFMAVNSGNNPLFADHGNKVFPSEYLAAPVDWRFDNNRKVWTGPQNVYSAHVVQTKLNGTAYTGGNTPQFIENIRYDVQLYDGVANRRIFTNLLPVSPRPAPSSFKVVPLNSGAFCLIVHTDISGIPGYGVYTNEQPGSEECLTSATGSATSAATFQSLAIGTGVVKYDVLTTTPLAAKYGGVGFSGYNNRQTIMSDGSGTLKKYTMQFGSGIEGVFSENSSTTGSFTIRIASGVQFTHNGLNSTITEIQGLTTPLTLAQGGTGASGKTFIDLTTNQSVSGIKQFSGPLLSSYSSTSGFIAGFSFTNDNLCGLGYLYGSGLFIMSTGQPMMSFSTGIWCRQPTLHHVHSSPLPSLIVKQNNIYIDPNRQFIQEWHNNSGNIVAVVNSGGYFASQGFIFNSGSATGTTLLLKGSGYVNNTIVMPTGNGTLLLNVQVTGFTGTVPAGSGLIVVNGLIQGYI